MRTLLLLLGFLCLSLFSHAAQLKTASFELTYADSAVLEAFHANVSSGDRFFLFGSRSNLTLEEQVENKMAHLVSKVQSILEMFPEKMFFKVVLFSSERDVQQAYYMEYGLKAHYIAFYSPLSDTIYISTNNVSLRVIAHEMAHAVIYHYFDKQPAVKIHELMAQFVEVHIQD